MSKIKSLLIFLFFFTHQAYSLENQIIVKVENKIITNFELKNKILSSLILNNLEINQKNINDIKKQTVDLLVLNKLKELEIEKYKIESQNNDINFKVQNHLNKITSNNILQLKNAFKNNGVSFNIFQREVKTELLWQDLIYKIYSNRIELDEKNINQEVEKMFEEQSSVEEIRLSEIEILIGSDKEKDVIASTQKNISELGFENTASKFSISISSDKKGDLGWLNSNSLSEEIYKKISNLKIGEYSKPIIRANSILFLIVKDKRKIKKNNLNKSDIKKQIINKKKNELFNLYSQSHLSKLKNTSLIEY